MLLNSFCLLSKLEYTYTQVRGTAMGTKFAPTYSTLALAYLEEKLYSEFEIKFGKEFAIFIKEKLEKIFRRLFCVLDKRPKKKYTSKGIYSAEEILRLFSSIHTYYPRKYETVSKLKNAT